jgi:hypothetical protein
MTASAQDEPGRVSDQLPEEAPAPVAPERTGEGAQRDSARELARRANRSGHRPGQGRDPGGEPARTDGPPNRRPR